MSKIRWIVLAALSAAACSSTPKNEAPVATGPEQTPPAHGHHAEAGQPLPLFDGLSSYSHKITTSDPEAQSYFDQGLMMAYAFNHAQAKRSFLEGAKRDPNCAMCYWGAALVLGPNINAPMAPEAESEALGYLAKAKAAVATGTAAEKGYVNALAARYAEPAGADRAARDETYAKAMRKFASMNAQDPDAAALAAEAMMDQHPWNYWTKTGKAQPWTNAIVTTLETTLENFPDHAGTHHLYIHAMEASPFPEKAVASADRLKTLVPAAGHLVHMPGHIYIRVGRYQDAIDSNVAAIEADRHQAMQSPGIYDMMYKPHNHHFLWAAATLAGQEELAGKAAISVNEHFKTHKMPNDPTMSMMRQNYEQTPVFNDVRFGHWAAILERPMPPAHDELARAIHHYARAVAMSKTGRAPAAIEEIRGLDELRAKPELQNGIFMNNKVATLLEIASRVAKAERSAALTDYKSAIADLEKARALEDTLTYNEPADWHHPIRQILGRVYLDAKQPKAAERVYLEDLRLYPKNAWSMTGLMKAYEAQGLQQKAADAKNQLGAIALPASSL